ncbi:hypothetical protein SDC9_198500 [bioreactor metagenome]|uniref:Uncharacterized protein n=1 Tax=bioreactor metagenome TaxID=1076179 RepID=A0A645IIB5_9ZZZZ
MKRVNVLIGRDSVDYFFLADMLRQRKLDEYSVHCGAAVQRVDKLKQHIFRGLLRQLIFLARYAALLAVLFLVSDINLGRGVLSDKYHRESGTARKFFYLGSKALFHFRGKRLAVHYYRHRFSSSLFNPVDVKLRRIVLFDFEIVDKQHDRRNDKYRRQELRHAYRVSEQLESEKIQTVRAKSLYPQPS